MRTLNNSKTHDIHTVSVKCYKQEVEGIDFLDTFTAPNIRKDTTMVSLTLRNTVYALRCMALTLMVTMLATMQTMAQDTKLPTCQVTGTIRDKATHEPELAATIIVAKQSQPKVAFKKGVTDTGGVFSLTLPATDARYILTASVLGKKAAQVKLTVTPADTLIDLGDILLADDARLLDEVQVLAQKPLVTMDVDKLTYDVASDPDAKYMMTSEILNKVPLLDVDGMGNIKMNGTTNFLILQNGRRTAVTRHPKEILRSLPAELIKSIEVITSPGAKYDAEGIGGIINIVMQRRYEGHLTNLNGAVNNMGFVTGLSTTTKIGRFSIDGYMNYNRILTPTGSNASHTYNYASESRAYQQTASSHKSRGSTEFANINASYEIDTLQLLTLSLSGMGSQQRLPVWGSTEMWNRDRSQLAYSYLRSSLAKESFLNGTAGIDYQRTGRHNKQRLTTLSYQISTNPQWIKDNTQYDEIVYNTPSDIIEELQLYANRTDADNKSVEHTLQADYTTPIDKHNTIETGLKYIVRNNESTNDIYDARIVVGDFAYNDQRSNHYKNRNDILAAYLSYTYHSAAVSLMPGLRYEYTYQDIRYLSGAMGADADYSGHYAYLVPSMKVNFKVGPHQSLRLEYGMRLSRPSIYYLNPYFNDLNPQRITQGNGQLDAERSHNFGITYGNFTRRLNLNMSLGYRRLDNGIEQVSRIIGDGGEYFDEGKHYAAPGALYSTYMNIGRTQRTALDVYLRWNMTNRISWTINSNVSYLDLSDPVRQLRNHGWQTSLSGSTSVRLPGDLRLMGRVAYSSRSVMLQGNNNSLLTYNIGLTRSFLKDKRLTLSLMATEFARSWMTRSTTTYGTNFYTQRDNQVKRQYFGLTVMYRFGTLRQSATKRASHGIHNDDLKAGGR